MILINFPQGMNADNWQNVILPGRLIEAEIAGDRHTIEWSYQGSVVPLVVDTGAGAIELDDATDQARIDLLQAALQQFGAGPAWGEMYNQIVSTAQSAVGVQLTSLTAGQRNALLALVLWDKKAIANDGTIRPLGKWVKRRP